MSRPDIGDLQAYVGNEEVRTDTVRAIAVHQFRDTLESFLAPDVVATVPPGFHWTLFPPLVPTSELGEDGHPRKLGLLPDLPQLLRMWAGGALSFHGPLAIGADLSRRTTLSAITEKAGTTGRLLFVTLDHEIRADGILAICETQTLVYRPVVRGGAPTATLAPERGGKGGFVADSRLLFRYSALTFNTHRIHYDQDYATSQEGYPGLVVHGPLQATLLMNRVAVELGHDRFDFSYRGTAPLYAGQSAMLCLDGAASGEAWVQRGAGDKTMQARFSERPSARNAD